MMSHLAGGLEGVHEVATAAGGDTADPSQCRKLAILGLPWDTRCDARAGWGLMRPAQGVSAPCRRS